MTAMGIATGISAPRLQQVPTRPAPKSGTFSAEREDHFTNSDSSNSATIPSGRNFFIGVGMDLVKTLSRALCGGMFGDIINATLKDGKFNLSGAVHSSFVDGFGSRVFADYLGAIFERLFNGSTVLLGLRFPKIPAEISTQIVTNFWVHLWRFCTNKYNVNQISAKMSSNTDPKSQQLKELINSAPGLHILQEANTWFATNIKPGLDKVISLLFGVKGPRNMLDENGQPICDQNGKPLKEPAAVNWWHLGPVTLASLIGTALLPKDTQQVGFSGIYNAKDTKASIFRFFSSTLMSVFGRLESTYFRNVLGLHRNGYDNDACLKATVRERMLTPIMQSVVDSVSAISTRYIQNFIPINGATLSLLIKLPFELISNLLSTGLVGIADSDRVPEEWKYLGFKYWLPVAKVIEVISKPLTNIADAAFRVILPGILPSKKVLKAKGLEYRRYNEVQLNPAIRKTYSHYRLVDDCKLLARACLKVFHQISSVLRSAHNQGEDLRTKVKAQAIEAAQNGSASQDQANKPEQLSARQDQATTRKIGLGLARNLKLMADVALSKLSFNKDRENALIKAYLAELNGQAR